MKHRYYFDTSVFGGVFDNEFKKYSVQLFDQVKRGEVVCLFSKTVVDELMKAPNNVVLLANNLPLENTEYIVLTEAAENLALLYIKEGVVGKKHIDDCRHIALATINRADLLISWNFKHIVNTARIAGYNSVNLKYGYQTIDIQSPKQLFDHEEKG